MQSTTIARLVQFVWGMDIVSVTREWEDKIINHNPDGRIQPIGRASQQKMDFDYRVRSKPWPNGSTVAVTTQPISACSVHFS